MLVSFVFQLFTIAVATYFALMPLGRHATRDLAALMIDTARLGRPRRSPSVPGCRVAVGRLHRLQVHSPSGEAESFARMLPYFRLLETFLSARAGEVVELRTSRSEDGTQWYWANLPVAASKVRVGFPASRVDVQPWLAMY